MNKKVRVYYSIKQLLLHIESNLKRERLHLWRAFSTLRFTDIVPRKRNQTFHKPCV